jgi:hypothetical protein
MPQLVQQNAGKQHQNEDNSYEALLPAVSHAEMTKQYPGNQDEEGPMNKNLYT